MPEEKRYDVRSYVSSTWRDGRKLKYTLTDGVKTKIISLAANPSNYKGAYCQHTLELLHHTADRAARSIQVWPTRSLLEVAFSEFMEASYNHRRRQYGLGYLGHDDYERKWFISCQTSEQFAAYLRTVPYDRAAPKAGQVSKASMTIRIRGSHPLSQTPPRL